jgi:molybdate transport system substrate-binding protein
LFPVILQPVRFGMKLTLAAAMLFGARAACRADEILVSAAASLTDAFKEIGAAYTRANPHTVVRLNFASSGALQQQIQQGAPVDVFASAAAREMDALQVSGHIENATRVNFAANRLVLITPRSGSIHRWEDLRSPSVRRVALANPASVPAGRYAKETLTHRGLWSVVQSKCVFGENVRQTLTYIANGDADAGVVFATDAQIDKDRVRVAQESSALDHLPIVYPAAVVRGAPNGAAARRFVSFLRGPVAQAILARCGFYRAPRP